MLEVNLSTVRPSETLQDLIVLARRCCTACGNRLVLQLISEVQLDASDVSNWTVSNVNTKSVTTSSPAAVWCPGSLPCQYSMLFAQVLQP